jgi:hypothetical protein
MLAKDGVSALTIEAQSPTPFDLVVNDLVSPCWRARPSSAHRAS